MTKCIILLSYKSSGSSALQKLLAKFPEIRHITETRHHQSETLYWTKAASILGYPQEKMYDSEVPLSKDKAENDLITLLKNNLDSYLPPHIKSKMIFNGWRLLCEKYSPVFLEKSPHHLFQWAALELIIECMERMQDVDFLLVGLIRNPMDTLYSVFRRWRAPPEKIQHEWVRSYDNLLKLKKIASKNLVIIRYEDMVSSLNFLKPVFDFCNVDINYADKKYMHDRSISNWRKNSFYGFNLSEDVISLAAKFNYSSGELKNSNHFFWPAYRVGSRVRYKVKEFGLGKLSSVKKIINNI